jgi:uncharacterized protein (TIGR02246 family)
MRRNLIVLALVGVLPAPAAAQQPPKEDPAHEELRALKRRLVEASNKDDIEGVLACLDKDVVVTWMNGEVSRKPEGVKAYLERMTRGPNRIVNRFKTSPEVEELTHLYGDTGVAFGTSKDWFELTDGREFEVPTRWSATVVKKDGKWLIANFHASVNAFDNAILWIAVRRSILWTAVIAVLLGLVLGFFAGRLRRRKQGGSNAPAPQQPT